MGDADISTNYYLSKNSIFADIMNYQLYNGKKVINPENLMDINPLELGLPYGKQQKIITVSKLRDIIKQYMVKDTDKATYVLLGLEEQTDIHYAMPVKNMVYDALNYAAQISDTAKKHHNQKDKMTKQEFLSGFKKNEKIKPVITTVLYLGADKWDGPRNLHDMLDTKDDNILHFISNYKINLIVPQEIEDFEQFHSELRYVLEFIKNSKDEKAVGMLLEDKREIYSKMELETAYMISKCTGITIKPDRKEKEINMCKAWDDHRESGRTEGEYTKLISLIRKKKAKDMPVEECADILEEELGVVGKIYDILEKYPEADDRVIYQNLQEELVTL